MFDPAGMDAFTVAYIEALFFTEKSPVFESEEWDSEECQKAQEEGQADGTLPGDVDVDDIHSESMKSIVNDCKAFQDANGKLLGLAYKFDGYSEAQAGHDFWLTRNGHGAGFWDRGLGIVGTKLTDASRPYGSVDMYYSAGKVCVS